MNTLYWKEVLKLCFRKVLPKCGEKELKTTSLVYRDNTSLGDRTASRQCRSSLTGEDMTNVLRHAYWCIVIVNFSPKCAISVPISTEMTHVPEIFKCYYKLLNTRQHVW